MTNRYYGKANEAEMRNTKHDIFRDVARGQFTNDRKDNYVFEHNTQVETVDENAFDFYYNKQLALRKIKDNTQERNETLRQLLKKRELKKPELIQYTELNKKKLQQNGLTFEEDMRFQALNSIIFSKDAEKTFRRAIDGIDVLYYYKDAHQALKQRKMIEWNKKRTMSSEPNWNSNILNKNPSVNIVVVKVDPVEYALKLKRDKLNPVLANTVSHLSPGGSWEKGEEGSEESLFYRSSYYLSLNSDEDRRDGFYPLMDEATMYSPKVMIFKSGKSRQYRLVQRKSLTFVSVIACCGLHSVETKPVNKNIMSDNCAAVYKNKIKNILQTALYWGHSSVVFDAFGFNVSSSDNPPVKHCASLIKDVLFDDKNMFYKKIKQVAFCIDIKNMSDVPKPTTTTDPNKFVHKRELSEVKKEEQILKIFHQMLNGIDKYSA